MRAETVRNSIGAPLALEGPVVVDSTDRSHMAQCRPRGYTPRLNGRTDWSALHSSLPPSRPPRGLGFRLTITRRSSSKAMAPTDGSLVDAVRDLNRLRHAQIQLMNLPPPQLMYEF